MIAPVGLKADSLSQSTNLFVFLLNHFRVSFLGLGDLTTSCLKAGDE
jgi:hypothetical protein